ncbi:TPA: two-component sensor histidine kinase [Escherichia coli]|nr:two-component sensor histidine kinase [Escherichia coli]
MNIKSEIKLKGSGSLWRWICIRLISLAVGSIILICFFMWLRFYTENLWHEYRMPEAVRAELSTLINNPEENISRYHEIIDTWYGLSYSDPTMGIADWFIVAVLVLIFIPIILFLTVRTVRPISQHISLITAAARSVSEGGFGATVPVPLNFPSELRSLSKNFNIMSLQLLKYENEMRKSHVILAHELRSPLTAAIGRLQGILDGVFEPSETQLRMIMQQMEDLNRLINDLHMLKLAEAGQLNLMKSPTDLGDILKEKIAWTSLNARKAGINIVLAPTIPMAALVDPYRLGQVFLILIDNAIRYAAEGGVLEISCNVNRQKIFISFIDKGPGVQDDFLNEIFSPFIREEQSRSRHSGGSGLGLSIARAICQAHDGTIKVHKNPVVGLNFTVILPRLQS